MLYDEARMALTKERLEDLRKEKKLSFEQLSKQLAERGVNISHTNLKNYEINDPVHPLYGRTRSMSIEYLVAFADFYDVSVEYLLGLSNSRKRGISRYFRTAEFERQAQSKNLVRVQRKFQQRRRAADCMFTQRHGGSE